MSSCAKLQKKGGGSERKKHVSKHCIQFKQTETVEHIVYATA